MRSGEYTSPANRPRLNLVYSLPSDSDLDGIENRIDNCIEVANPDQRDTDEDGYGNRCDPDLNNDGIVNTLDIIPFKTAFGTSGPHADFDGDGVVSTLDIVIFKAYFGQAPGPAASGNN
jgi:hypothetical protein